LSTDLASKEIDTHFRAVDEFSYDHTPASSVRRLRQAEKVVYGDYLNEPSAQGKVLLDTWQAEEVGGDDPFDWHAEYKRQSQVEMWNDAELYGEDCPEWQAVLDTQVHPTLGEVRPGRKGTPDDGWNASPGTWRELIEGKSKPRPWGISRHVKSARKDGSAFVFAACDKYRRANAVKAICAITLDIDSGEQDSDEVLKIVQRENVAAIVSTSFSNMTTELELKHSEVAKLGPITDESVREFLTKQAKLADHIIASAVVQEECAETPDGWKVKVKTDPIPKLRATFPLEEGDVRISEMGSTQPEAHATFKRKVLGLCEKLGIKTDPATLDVSRAFYAARHKKNAEWRIAVHRAPPLRFADVPMAEEVSKKAGKTKRREDVMVQTPDGVSINISERYERYGKRYMLADIAEHCDLGTSANAPNGGGKFHVRCPFADGHTDTSDDTATCVWNAEDSSTEFAVVKCQHASCADRHTIDFLAAWIESGELDPAILEDPDFMAPVPDEGEERFLCETPQEALGKTEARAILREHLATNDGVTVIAEGAVDEAEAQLTQLGLSEADARQRVHEAVCDVQRQIDARNSPDADPNQDGEEPDVPVSVLAPLYDDDLVTPEGFLVTPEKAPKVYRRYGIKTDDKDHAYLEMQREVRNQIYASLSERFDYVVVDGETKIAVKAPQGERVHLYKESTIKNLFRNRTVKYIVQTQRGEKTEFIRAEDVYFNDRRRATYLDTCFEPQMPGPVGVRFNLWNGFAVTPRPGDWSLLRRHIEEVICHYNEEYFNFSMTWFASPYARPGIKVPSSLAILGEQGTGKSKVLDWYRKGIGSAALKISSNRHLTGTFNAHMDGLIFMTAEEAFWAGRKEDAGRMKDLISSDTLEIERKHHDVVTRPNYVNLAFVSNNKWVAPVDGEDARRFFVLECANTYKKNAAYFGAIDDQMENGGLEAMAHEFMNWNPADVGMTWHDLRNPPITDSLRQQAGMGLTGPAEILVSVLENGQLSGRTSDGDAFHYELSEDELTIVARSHLVGVLNPNNSRGNLTQEMKEAICTFLGDDADSGDNKVQVEYFGAMRSDKDEREIRITNRTRYVTVPALKTVKDTLMRYGRG